MAMLLVNRVFARTWGERVGAPPGGEYVLGADKNFSNEVERRWPAPSAESFAPGFRRRIRRCCDWFGTTA